MLNPRHLPPPCLLYLILVLQMYICFTLQKDFFFNGRRQSQILCVLVSFLAILNFIECLLSTVIYLARLRDKLIRNPTLVIQDAFRAFHNDLDQVQKYLLPLHIGSVQKGEVNTNFSLEKDFRNLRETAENMVLIIFISLIKNKIIVDFY